MNKLENKIKFCGVPVAGYIFVNLREIRTYTETIKDQETEGLRGLLTYVRMISSSGYQNALLMILRLIALSLSRFIKSIILSSFGKKVWQ